MSAVYNLEPPPTAKVLLTTTSGDLSLELFAKQTPLASRNFLQHCLNGYYNGTLFHRLVSGFIIQGGDPTNTGDGGESVYPGGAPFEDEFHSRLKFTRRGLLGMANEGSKGSNGSQFFLTLGETRELEGRNTLFGRVVGDTIYNLMKMGEAELQPGERSERPIYPTRVTGAEILVNPFEDMVRTEVKVRVQIGEKHEAKKKGKKKGAKALLSFGGEEGEDGVEGPVLKKEKFNTKLVSDGGDDGARTVNGASRPAERGLEKRIQRRSSRSKTPPHRIEPHKEMQLPLPKDEEPSRSTSSSPEPEQVGKVSSLLDKTNAQIADLKASMKRKVQMAPAADIRKKSALEQMIPEKSMRGRKRKHNGDTPADKQTLDILTAFRAKLEQAPLEIEPLKTSVAEEQDKQGGVNGHDKEEEEEEANGNDEEEAQLCDLHFIANCQSCQSWYNETLGNSHANDDDNQGWMYHALSFDKDRLGKDLNWKKKNEEELVLIDPREKAKDIREEQRAKKMARMGGSNAWDRDRDRGRLPDRRAGEKGK
ncbi:MAG: Peptidyl-prolyl isomerase cwc27 [Alectoria fallacina]|uniref:Peptidyl-prolyl isomerase cwc27 n=1 Tax=Alectoria fallacina TaxID=1903189 RepID=A0A8H3FEB1_9LECA|nr:MAG: Peptidyl-prolyl isomerase cwc27 [Alectoria fallacina]